MTTLSLHLLGAPIIALDGQGVTVGHTKALALLAYLAVTRRPHTRDALAGLLWPEFEQQRARSEVRRMVWALNSALGKGWLEADRQTVGLAPAANIRLDVAEVRQRLAVERSHAHPADELCAACRESLAQAVEAYSADFLAGFSLPDSEAFEQWQLQERHQLRREVTQALDRLIGWHLAADPPEPAPLTRYALKRLALDPAHEPAHRLLMALHAATRQPAAALEQYRRCVAALRSDLDVSPAAETEALAQRIRQGSLDFSAAELRAAFGLPPLPQDAPASPAPPAPRTPPHNLPAQITPFVGRTGELADLSALLTNPDVRFISIVGPGGMGKTRLALEVGPRVLAHFPDGVFWVELAPLKDSAAIIPVLAEAIGYQFQPGGRDQTQQVLDYLAQKRLLLLLDNFEQLIAGASIIIDILERAPQIKILITARQRLNQLGETVFILGGMGLPSWHSAQDAFNYASIQLFRQSAQRLRPGFNLTGDNLAEVVQICRLVQGMPLAILLAASWISVLSPAEIAAEIQNGLDILETTEGQLPERQRSIRAIFNYSWQMLTPPEQQAFMKMSIFRGGFTREAAQAVAGGTLRQLQTLIGKALLTRDQASNRYQIHELLRQYAEAQLATSGQLAETVAAHTGYYLDYLARQAPALKSAGQQTALKLIDADFENIRQAWRSAIDRQQHDRLNEALEAMVLFCYLESRLEDGKSLFEAVRVGLAAPPGQKPHPVWHRAGIRFYADEETGQLKLRLRQALALAQQRDDRAEAAFCLHTLATLAHYVDQEPAAAIEFYKQAAALYRQLGEQYYLAHTLSKLGEAYQLTGQTGQTLHYVSEAHALQQVIGDQMGESETLRALAMTAYQLGQYEQSFDYLAQSFVIQQRTNFIVGQASSHLFSGWLLCIRGELAAGRQRIETALALALDVVDYSTQAWCYAILGLLDVWAGDWPAAQAKLTQAEAIETDPFRQTGAGNPFLKMHTRWLKSLLLLREGQLEAAKTCFGPVLKLACQTNSHPYITHSLLVVALFHAAEGEYDAATALLGLAEAQSSGTVGWLAEWAWLAEVRQSARKQLGPAAFEAARHHAAAQNLLAVAVSASSSLSRRS